MSYDREVSIGTVSAVNADSTIDVRIDNRLYPYASIGVPHKMTLQEHDSVLVGYYNKDRSLPFVLSRSNQRANNGPAVIIVSPWHQFHMTWPCARLTTHKITGTTMANFTQEWNI